MAAPIILMGVAGCGKTTLGMALAQALTRPFLDADDLHSDAARAAMAKGVALTDADRAPWLARLNRALLDDPQRVLACSALRASYRATLAAGLAHAPVWVHLQADQALIAERLARRVGHMFHPSLLDSQFAILEPPDDALTLQANDPIASQIAAICAYLDTRNAHDA